MLNWVNSIEFAVESIHRITTRIKVVSANQRIDWLKLNELNDVNMNN